MKKSKLLCYDRKDILYALLGLILLIAGAFISPINHYISCLLYTSELMHLVAMPAEKRLEMGKNSRAYFERKFAREKLISQMDGYLTQS